MIDCASAPGTGEGDNPAWWRGGLDNLLPKPAKVKAVKHHTKVVDIAPRDFPLPAQSDGTPKYTSSKTGSAANRGSASTGRGRCNAHSLYAGNASLPRVRNILTRKPARGSDRVQTRTHTKMKARKEATMIKRPNEKNERLKRQFIDYRKHARQLSDKSLDRGLAALERFDVRNGRKDFAQFHIQWAMGFRMHLETAINANGKPLSKSTLRAMLATMREFTIWFSQQDGFRSRIRTADADYFKLSRRDEAEARAAPPRAAPGIKQAKRALALMPGTTPRENVIRQSLCSCA